MTLQQGRRRQLENSGALNRQVIGALGTMFSDRRPGAFTNVLALGRNSAAEGPQGEIERRSTAIPVGASRQGQKMMPPLAVSASLTPPGARGGLAPWQKRKVDAFLNTHLHRSVQLAEIARQAPLSVSHFCRAFRETFGTSPHAHIVSLRVEAAKRLMRDSGDPLSHIAYACGFADQSHLTKQFRRYVGETPHAWRRSNISGRRLATVGREALTLALGHNGDRVHQLEERPRSGRERGDKGVLTKTTF